MKHLLRTQNRALRREIEPAWGSWRAGSVESVHTVCFRKSGDRSQASEISTPERPLLHGSIISEVTVILQRVGRGETQAAEELLPLVYEELRRLAAARLAHEAPGQTLQATALVHEAWLRLAGDGAAEWNGRGHFFGAAAEAMRRILIDRARRRNRLRHGAGLQRVDIDDVQIAADTDDETLLRVDEALVKLAAEEPDRAALVKLRFYAGLTLAEAARARGISLATAKRHWAFARAWLWCELSGPK